MATLKPAELIDSVNIAEHLDEKELIKIGSDAEKGYQADLTSRAHWEDLIDCWTKIALQVSEKKTFPWQGASNVKFPLLATASMQFAARAYPSLVPSNGQVVKCKVVGYDTTGEKAKRAERVSKFMSYQIMDEMTEWEQEMDKLLITLPIVGTVFKKTYWDAVKQRNKSCLVMPKQLVINYFAKSIDEAERVTEIIPMSRRAVKEKQLAGLYLDVDLAEPTHMLVKNQGVYGETQPEVDITTPYTICEQHTFLDLDNDGYSEPYIVTFESQSKKVLRITARFTEDNVQVDAQGKIIRIDPTSYYTKFGFIPNPDGGFYDIGFGRLLGPINESADTLINQLIDAGTMSNLQAGFIGKGLRIKMGDSKFQPGEWKAVNATGDDIKKQIFPLPTREPSAVLMQLLQFLIQSGKELASIAEIFVGKMPGQNTPATTTMATIEQGMKVFTAVYKRIFRSLTEEFRKIYILNRIYLNPETEVDVLDTEIPQSDFQGSANDIVPGADPAAVSNQEKQAKIQAVMQILQLGTIDPMMVTKMYLDAFEIPNAEQLIKQPVPPEQQPPTPEQIQMQMSQQEHQQQMILEQRKAELNGVATSQRVSAEKAISDQKIQHQAVMGDLELQKAASLAHTTQQIQGADHAQKMSHAEQQHMQKMQQQKQMSNNKPKKE